MRIAFLLWLLIWPVSAPVAAGPWPRAAGEGFASAAAGRERTGGQSGAFAGIYGEYGWTHRLTFSAELERRTAGAERLRWEAGARLHLGDWRPGSPVSLGVGLRHGHLRAGSDGATRLRAVVHLGHGLTAPGQGGWARVSLSALAPLGSGPVHYESHSQIGLRPSTRSLAMLSLSTYHTGSDDYIKLSPAVGHEIGQWGTLVVEATRDFGASRDRRLTLSVWRAF